MQEVTTNLLSGNMYYKDILVLKYNIEYPVFHSTCSESGMNKINEYYAAFAKRKENYCRNTLYPQAVENAMYISDNRFPFNNYEYSISYKITFNGGCIVSLYMEEYIYMGGAHGSTIRSSDTWDFMTGKRLQLKDIYKQGNLSKEKILNWLKNQISQQLKATPNSYFEDYAKLVWNTFSMDNFYLTPEGVIIYFQQYDIAPYAAGIPEFLLPYKFLYSIE